MDCGNAVSGDWRLVARRILGERGTSVPWLWFLRLCNWTYARVLSPAFRRKFAQRSMQIPPEGGTTNDQPRQVECHWAL